MSISFRDLLGKVSLGPNSSNVQPMPLWHLVELRVGYRDSFAESQFRAAKWYEGLIIYLLIRLSRLAKVSKSDIISMEFKWNRTDRQSNSTAQATRITLDDYLDCLDRTQDS